MSDATAPRILLIAGSPRRGGNTDALLDACGEGVRRAGGEVDLLIVEKAGVGPCTGCSGCSRYGSCIVSDGMSEVYPRIDAADAIVVATPVYFATVPAVLKALYDRFQPYWAKHYVLHQPIVRRRPAGLIVVGGGGDPFGDGCAITPTKSVFAVLGLDYLHELRVEADDIGDALAQDGRMSAAREVGESLVREAAERAANA
jgi:multimeric flavodoxin WrbA